ncbi:MAG: c-type cytochrome [Bergeyella sp.]
MRFFSAFLMVIFLFSCSKKPEKPVEEEISVFNPPAMEKSAEKSGNKSIPGYSLITGSDCLSCHKDNERFIGPSYAEVAEKYSEKDIELLASKIIDGGVGTWGQVPMQAHPNISKEDAKKMVEYILSMKK